MLGDLAQRVDPVVNGIKKLAVKGSNNEAIGAFSETDKTVIFDNNLEETFSSFSSLTRRS